MLGRNTQSKMLQWEKILKVMLTGEPVTKESLEAMPEMKDVPLYRLSTFVWRIKVTGGVVKVVKDGRKIAGYQLMNLTEMQKYLDRREKVFANAAKKITQKAQKKADRAASKIVKTIKVVKTLKDLNAQPVKQVKVTVPPKAHIDLGIAKIEVEEITETQ